MLFLLLTFGVPPLVFCFLPVALGWLAPGRRGGDRLLLAAGCLCYMVSWFLPSPLIDGEDTQFTTHVVGGGIFTGFLWLYVVRQLEWTPGAFLEILSLYATVSALGVANELFELTVTRLGLARLTPCDTWWDLLANTAGAAVFWLGYRGVRAFLHPAA